MHDWSRVGAGIYHNFHYLWLSAITNRLNAGLLPKGTIAMAEQVIGGTEPDVVALQQNHISFSTEGRSAATMTEAPPQPKTQFVVPLEAERYAAKAHRVVVRHSLGKVLAVVELVCPGNKDSRHALRSFVEKTVHLLYDNINLLVIDPFPPGPRDPQGIHKAIWDEITDEPFELPNDRKLTLAAYQAAPIKTAFIEPFAIGKPIPEMPLFLHNDFYINVPLEQTYMDTWTVLPQLLRDLVL
ncbi:DUF4058 family protein [Prosthecobacter sp.]|uniref:DUF4058 family protein n=1 Tax=Prosthecobacter sp. TaxID=1965333 RepID=UPI003904D591